jgi:hypothetical protein
MCEISKTARNEMQSMTSGDFVIVWGGSNDIGRNNTREALKFTSELVSNHKELNMVLINSPQRHDLLPESCVNHEVIKFNRKLIKIMKPALLQR